MELDKLIIEISADSAEFVRALNQNSKVLKDFGITGTATADQLTKALASIARESKKATDPEQVRVLSAVYAELSAKLKIVNTNIANYARQVDESGNVTEGFGKKTKKGVDALTDADEASRRARIAVYGLNQVVRDLPFGFIAISNNIPVLIDQFQELIRTKKGTTAAFKEFAKGLVSAGGVSVAISAVISLITAAVQKYGSLSNAVTALTSDLGPLIERLNEANKQYEKFLKESLTLPDVRTVSGVASDSDIARLDNLIRGLRDENNTYEEKQQILKRIGSQYGDLFQGYDLQKSNLQSVIAVLEEYKSAIRTAETEKGFTKQLDDTNKQLADTKVILNALNVDLDKARKKNADLAKSVNNLNKYQGTNALSADATRLAYAQSNVELGKLLQKQKELQTQISALTIQQYEYGKSLDETTNQSIFNSSEAARLAASTLKKTGNEQDKANKKRVSGNFSALQAQLAQEKSYLQTLNNLSKEFEDQQIKIATLERDIKAAQLKQQIVDRNEFSDAIKAIDADLQNEIYKIVADGITRRVEARKQETAAAKIAAEELKKAYDSIPKAVPDASKLISPQQIQAFLAQVDASRQSFVESEKARLLDLTNQALIFADAIGNFTGDFVQGLMNGESAIEGLIDGMKKLAREIAIAAAKAIALELIYQALNIASGGTAGTAAKQGKGLIDIFRRPRVAAPTINPTMGMAVGPGGLAIQGNVTFVQRGQDLVGVLARSNARINRVG